MFYELENFGRFKTGFIHHYTEKCKGVFFRCSISRYWVPKRYEMVEKVSLRFLKSKSCKGCEFCGWVFDYILDDVNEGHIFPVDPVDKAVYAPHVVYATEDDFEWNLQQVK